MTIKGILRSIPNKIFITFSVKNLYWNQITKQNSNASIAFFNTIYFTFVCYNPTIKISPKLDKKFKQKLSDYSEPHSKCSNSMSTLPLISF